MLQVVERGCKIVWSHCCSMFRFIRVKSPMLKRALCHVVSVNQSDGLTHGRVDPLARGKRLLIARGAISGLQCIKIATTA